MQASPCLVVARSCACVCGWSKLSHGKRPLPSCCVVHSSALVVRRPTALSLLPRSSTDVQRRKVFAVAVLIASFYQPPPPTSYSSSSQSSSSPLSSESEKLTAHRVTTATIDPITVGGGFVHWVLPPTATARDEVADECLYQVCTNTSSSPTNSITTTCTPPAKLNAPEVHWAQCLSVGATGGQPTTPNNVSTNWINGLACVPGLSTLRVFGKGLAFDTTGDCAAYHALEHRSLPVKSDSAVEIRLTPIDSDGDDPQILSATTQSCYDATFDLPNDLAVGDYLMEFKSNLPSATWVTARDPDQHSFTVYSPIVPFSSMTEPCAPYGNVHTVTDRDSLLQVLSSLAGDQSGRGGTIQLSPGIYEMELGDSLTIPQCVVVQGSGTTTTRLVWPEQEPVSCGVEK